MELWLKSFQKLFRKCIQFVQKIVPFVFFVKTLLFSSDSGQFFLQFEFNKIDSDLKISNYLCKGTFGKIFPNETTFESSTSSRKLSNFDWKVCDKIRVFQLLCAKVFLVTFFPGKLWLFWTVSLNIHGLAEMFSTVLSKVQSRRGRQRPGFFLIPQLFCVELEHFYVNFRAKKLQFFSKKS